MNPNWGVLYEWTLDESVNTPVEVVGDGGGTTKTKWRLSVKLQLTTELNQWLIVNKLNASTTTTQSFHKDMRNGRTKNVPVKYM